MIKFSLFVIAAFMVGCSNKPKLSKEEKVKQDLELIKKQLFGEDTAYNRKIDEQTALKLMPTKRLRSPAMIERENRFIDSIAKTGSYTEIKFYHSPIERDSNGKYISEYFCSMATPIFLHNCKDSLRKESKKILRVIYKDVLKGDTVVVGVMNDTVRIVSLVSMYIDEYDWYDRQGFRYGVHDKVFKRK